MKKMRILALIMTCAILLSSIMIPVAATETPTPSLSYTATNVVGRDVTIDGYANAEEGWSKDPAFTLSAYRNQEVSADATAEGWSVDEDPTEVRISYDEDYLYFYYETSNPSGTHPYDNQNPKRNGTRLYVGIAPNDRGLIDDRNTNNGETIWLVMNFYEPADPNQAETVTWEGMSADGTIGTQATQNLVSQLCWTTDQAKLTEESGWLGYYGKQNTLVNFKVVYVYNPETKTQCLEFKIPLAYSYKQALKTDDGASFRIGINERPYDTSDGAAGYTIEPGSFRWNLPVGEGVTLNLPKTNGTTRVAQNVAGKTITVDGVMGADEGWSQEAMFYTTHSNYDAILSHGVTYNDKQASKLRISTDGKNIYFFYEIIRDELVNASWINSNGSGQWLMPELFLYFAPEGEHLEAQTPEDHCFRLNLRLFKESNMTGVVPIEGVPGSYKWDGSLYTESQWQQNDDNWEHILGFMNYGFVDPSKVNGNSNKTYGSYEGGYLQGMEIAINRTTKTNRLSIEISVPVSEELGRQLQNGTANYRVAALERTYRYNGSPAVDSGGNNYAGYTMAPGTLLCESNTFEAPWNGNWMFLSNCGYVFTLPQVSSDKTSISPELVGFQSRVNPDDATKFDVRFVSVVNENYAINLNASKLGYLFGYNAKTSMQYCTKVYTELNAGNGTIKASDFGGKYFFCYTITGLSTTGAYTFTAKCFTQYNETAQQEYCTNPVTVTVTYEDGKAVFTKGQNS